MDNIRSAYNVGSIFRTADGAGATRIFLCGFTPTPENPKVLKTSLGAEKTIEWEYCKQTWRIIDKLKAEGLWTIALETTKNSKNIFQRSSIVDRPLALIVGNEVKGVRASLLKRADQVVHIPMRGEKESLNVAVAAGIAVYEILK